MHCPDCGKDLVKTAVVGFDESFRCENCGGTFLTGWVVNRIAQQPEENYVIQRKNIKGVYGGNNCCPTDSEKLAIAGGDELPSQVVIKKCNKCSWWWFPDDQIFELQSAYLLKREYLQKWHPKVSWQTLVLPALISLFLTIGLVGGVSLVSKQQQINIGATVGIRNWTVTNMGSGVAEVSFKSGLPVAGLQYKNNKEANWRESGVECMDDLCRAQLKNLTEGEQYVVRILGKEYTFKVQ
jgi:hypothetical protein